MLFEISSSAIFPKLLRRYSTCKLLNVTINDKTGIAVVALQRPPVNCLNLDLLKEVLTTVKEQEKNRCQGLILTSNFDGVFSAGLDIREMYKPKLDHLKELWTTLQDVWINLYGSSYPTVAVVNGHAPAGGCLLALSCDYRIMLNNFTIGFNESQLGAMAPSWFAATMRNLIGFRQTELALITGELFTTNVASEIGLVDKVAQSKEEGIRKAEQFLQRFRKVPGYSTAMTKRMLRGADIQKLVDNKDKDLDGLIKLITSPKLQDAVAVYLRSQKKGI